jgi:hypothetical protein
MAEPGWPLEGGYRIDRLAEQDVVSAADIVALWGQRAAVTDEEAQRRLDEVLLVATDASGALAGVTSVYVQRNEQLRMDLWNQRAFVAREHRHSTVALWLARIGVEQLETAFVDGRDTRAPGIVWEIENEGLKAYFHRGTLMPPGFHFIGENARGDHVRVYYFPGATAPEP